MQNLARQDCQLPQILQIAEYCADPLGLDHYLRSFWHYQKDPEWTEYVMQPAFQLAQAEENGYYYGDCDDAATLAACISTAMGYPCRFIAYRMVGNPEFSHVNLRCDTSPSGECFDIDPTVSEDKLPIVNGIEETLEVIV